MTQARLESVLRSMVQRYGFEQVNESLQEIGTSKSSPSLLADAQANKRPPRITALQYVAKMDLSPDKKAPVIELARRFDHKAFLPTTGDIVNFCQVYRLNKPASKSRASAIPRVFKYVASMDAGGIQKILDEGMFSGPSRLGPIADAIRSNSRARAAEI